VLGNGSSVAGVGLPSFLTIKNAEATLPYTFLGRLLVRLLVQADTPESG